MEVHAYRWHDVGNGRAEVCTEKSWGKRETQWDVVPATLHRPGVGRQEVQMLHYCTCIDVSGILYFECVFPILTTFSVMGHWSQMLLIGICLCCKIFVSSTFQNMYFLTFTWLNELNHCLLVLWPQNLFFTQVSPCVFTVVQNVNAFATSDSCHGGVYSPHTIASRCTCQVSA